MVADKGPGGNYLDSGWETLKPFIAFYEAKSTCIYLDGGRSNSSQLTWHLEQSAVSAAWGPVSGIHQEAGGFLTGGGASVRVIGPGSPLHMSIFQELCRKRASNSHRPPPGLTCGPLSGHGRVGVGGWQGSEGQMASGLLLWATPAVRRGPLGELWAFSSEAANCQRGLVTPTRPCPVTGICSWACLHGSKEGPLRTFLALFPSPTLPLCQAQWQAGSKLLGFMGAVCQPLAPLSWGSRVRQGICPQGPSGFLGMAGNLLLTYEAVLLRSDSGGGCHPKKLW